MTTNIHSDESFARVCAPAPLIEESRRADIVRFYVELRELETRHGLRLVNDDALEIHDTSKPPIPGYPFCAIIRDDGTLEIAELVED